MARPKRRVCLRAAPSDLEEGEAAVLAGSVGRQCWQADCRLQTDNTRTPGEETVLRENSNGVDDEHGNWLQVSKAARCQDAQEAWDAHRTAVVRS